jgi:PHS family inorganic phosphate transporter-like MFS transporter
MNSPTSSSAPYYDSYRGSPIFRHVEQNLTSLEEQEKIKRKKFNWFMVWTILTTGAGYFTDAYDVFIINSVTPMIGYVYYSGNGNKIPANIEGVVKGLSLVGTLMGQLFFGFAGDIMGRRIYGSELLVIITGTINCATSASTVRGVSVLGFLGLRRLVLGFGIGGDYPLPATIASE